MSWRMGLSFAQIVLLRPEDTLEDEKMNPGELTEETARLCSLECPKMPGNKQRNSVPVTLGDIFMLMAELWVRDPSSPGN